MTTLDFIAFRAEWEERLAKQQPHEVHQPLAVRWDLPWDAEGCVMRKVQRLAVDESSLDELKFHEHVEELRVTWQQLKDWQSVRQGWIKRMRTDPFQYGWISEYFRPILIDMCRRRLRHPGEVLEQFITGGNRPGKTMTLIHLLLCNFIYAIKPRGMEKDEDEAWIGRVMLLHETEPMARKYHHPPVFQHLPIDLKAQARKKTTAETKFHYNAGGFTGNSFKVLLDVTDETGRKHTGGGEFEFRNYNQEEDSFQGGEYNAILSDELIPPALVTTLNARLASRVELTREAWFLERVRDLLARLVAGDPFDNIPRALLGACLQGWHVIAFTPIKFYTATAKMFLAGARKSGWTEAPALKTIAGVGKTTVPRFAQPTDPLRGVAYIPTSANIHKPAYHAILGGARSGGPKQVRMKLFGDVESDVQGDFAAVWNPERHLCEWKDIPRDGTLYEVIDGADAKPYFIGWFIVDALQRRWQVQEWPCESIPINGALPGPWAVVSLGDRMNGDEGPAQDLRLDWGFERTAALIWEMRARFVRKMKETGDPWRGKVETRTIKWNDRSQPRELTGEFAVPYETWGDPRWAEWKDRRSGGSIQKAFYELPDGLGITIMVPEGVRVAEGNTLVRDSLAADVMGQPKVQVNKECTNTQFMFANITTPEFAESTRKKDEACSDPNAVWRYFELADPVHVDESAFKVERGGHY